MSSASTLFLRFASLALVLGAGPACGAQEPSTSSEPETASSPSAPLSRVLVIGWDGATFEMIDPLLEAGRLPNLAKLVERGRSARLESTRIPISAAAWTTMSTGRHPGQHGVYSFFESVPGSQEVQLISSKSVMQPPLWRILSAQGKRSHVFGVPVTWPPEEIDGTIVAGMLSPLDGVWATPPSVHADLKEKGFVPDLGIWREKQALNMPRLKKQLAIKEEAVLSLLGQDDWTLGWVVFKNLDVMSHRVYDGTIKGPVAKVYEHLDASLGRIMAQVEAASSEESSPIPTDILLVSDHGFRSYKKTFNLQTWMLHEGFSVIADSISPELEEDPAPLAEARVSLNRRRLAQLNFDLTRAVTGPCEGNFGSIRVCVEGRDVDGEFPLKDLTYLLDEIEDRLNELVTPDYLDPMIKNVWRMDQLYSGDQVERLPDLVFEVDEEYLVRNALDLKMFTRFESPPVADHALEGVFFAAGPNIAPATERSDMTVLDIAPTLMHLLDLPAHEEMEGATLIDLLGGAAATREPSRVRAVEDPAYKKARKATYPAPGAIDKAKEAEEATEVEERLGDIGYTD